MLSTTLLNNIYTRLSSYMNEWWLLPFAWHLRVCEMCKYIVHHTHAHTHNTYFMPPFPTAIRNRTHCWRTSERTRESGISKNIVHTHTFLTPCRAHPHKTSPKPSTHPAFATAHLRACTAHKYRVHLNFSLVCVIRAACKRRLRAP